MYMNKTNASDCAVFAKDQAFEERNFVAPSRGRRKSEKLGKSDGAELLSDISKLWVKADQKNLPWMKEFLELLIEYSLGHLEGDNAAKDLEAKFRQFAR
jgi:hypothetical protein